MHYATAIQRFTPTNTSSHPQQFPQSPTPSNRQLNATAVDATRQNPCFLHDSLHAYELQAELRDKIKRKSGSAQSGRIKKHQRAKRPHKKAPTREQRAAAREARARGPPRLSAAAKCYPRRSHSTQCSCTQNNT